MVRRRHLFDLVALCRLANLQGVNVAVQETVKRIVESLQARGYLVWFDLNNMTGSTVDAMSDAVDNAELMLICVSLAYKESASELRNVACLLRND